MERMGGEGRTREGRGEEGKGREETPCSPLGEETPCSPLHLQPLHSR